MVGLGDRLGRASEISLDEPKSDSSSSEKALFLCWVSCLEACLLRVRLCWLPGCGLFTSHSAEESEEDDEEESSFSPVTKQNGRFGFVVLDASGLAKEACALEEAVIFLPRMRQLRRNVLDASTELEEEDASEGICPQADDLFSSSSESSRTRRFFREEEVPGVAIVVVSSSFCVLFYTPN